MENKIAPKIENQFVGFDYEINAEQLESYAKWTIEEKLNWICNSAKFIFSVQTENEKKNSKLLKGKIIS